MQFNARVRAFSPRRPEGEEAVYSYHQICAWLVELLWQGRVDKEYQLIIQGVNNRNIQFTVKDTRYEVSFGEEEGWSAYILELFMNWALLHEDTCTPEVYAFFTRRFASKD